MFLKFSELTRLCSTIWCQQTEYSTVLWLRLSWKYYRKCSDPIALILKTELIQLFTIKSQLKAKLDLSENSVTLSSPVLMFLELSYKNYYYYYYTKVNEKSSEVQWESQVTEPVVIIKFYQQWKTYIAHSFARMNIPFKPPRSWVNASNYESRSPLRCAKRVFLYYVRHITTIQSSLIRWTRNTRKSCFPITSNRLSSSPIALLNWRFSIATTIFAWVMYAYIHPRKNLKQVYVCSKTGKGRSTRLAVW